ncbi:MAG: FAD-dependent oxidoreductase [Kofleriaceae bacterium]|nr:FAD-dependent oxidoreductase [Kofleriaceae bacterium]MBP9203763.1 FAD-dependent oxidoreductase [Kofleriaceae bacterium]
MARTPLYAALRRALVRAALANRDGLTTRVAPPALGPSRRALLGGVLAGAALAPLAAACRPARRRDQQPVIAIVGGGMAGLLCAYRLKQAGLWATVYEASDRVGGRMYSLRGHFADGMVCELGGELIDTEHTHMHALAREFDLVLDDLAADTAGLAADTFHFGGRVLGATELATAMRPVAARMAAAVSAADGSPGEFARLDALSIAAWLEREAQLAPDALIRRVIEVAYTAEFGAEVDQQSSLNLLTMIDYQQLEPLRMYGDSDERYHTHAGNDALVGALAERLTDRIALGHVLTALTPARAGHGFQLGFEASGDDVAIPADHVVLALPFTRLRQLDLAALALPPRKQLAISELGYGSNSKLMLQFAARPWRTTGRAAGNIFTDVGQLQSTIETSRGQAGAHGLLTNFVGGQRGLASGDGSAEDQARRVVPWIDAVYPGAAAAYVAGRAVRQHWPSHPFTLGSYSCYRPGQAGLAGVEGARVGRLHFCGEHTSVEFQGYMEGAAETGTRVAAEILADLGG